MTNNKQVALDEYLGDTLLPSLAGYTRLPNFNASIKPADIFDHGHIPGEHVSENSVPRLFKTLKNTCETLKLDHNMFVLKVFPQWDIQGYAYISKNAPYITAISSGSVERLDEQELSFLIGHEIGHCLMGSLIEYNKNSTTLEDLIYSRRLEISADRFGYLAVNDIKIAANTIMKLMTGLSNEYLDYDINKFLNEKIDYSGTNSKRSSHPDGHLRIKYLHQYSLISYEDLVQKRSNLIKKINKSIERELDKLIDNEVYDDIKKRINELAIWLFTLPILMKQQISVNTLCKSLSVEVDLDQVKKAITFISSIPDRERADNMSNNIHQLINDAIKTGPRATYNFLTNYNKLFPTIQFDNPTFYNSIFE
jgi:hypothetical protein